MGVKYWYAATTPPGRYAVGTGDREIVWTEDKVMAERIANFLNMVLANGVPDRRNERANRPTR